MLSDIIQEHCRMFSVIRVSAVCLLVDRMDTVRSSTQVHK